MGSFLKDVFRVGTSQILIIVFGLVTSIVTARCLGPEGNGIIAGITVYPALFMTIGSLGIRQSTAYFLGKDIFSEHQIKRAIVQIWFFTSIFSLVICYVLIKFFSNSGDNNLWLLLSLSPIVFTLFVTYNTGIYLGKNDLQTFNKINWIPPLIIMISNLILIWGLSLGVTGALISLLLGPLVMFLIMLFKNDFINYFSFKINIDIIKKMLSLGLIYAFSLLIINLNYKVDFIMLDKLSNSYELGIFSKGNSLSSYLWQIPTVLSTIVFARSAASKNDLLFSQKIAQLLRVSFVIIGIGTILLYLFSDLIIDLMFGNQFAPSSIVQKILLPGVLLLTIFKVMNMDLAGKGKPWVAMKAMIPSLLINIALNWFLIPNYGANGSAAASTVSYAVSGILFLFFYSKEVGIPVSQIIMYKKTDFDPIFSILKKINK